MGAGGAQAEQAEGPLADARLGQRRATATQVAVLWASRGEDIRRSTATKPVDSLA
jgi:hypothetical protein